MDQNNNEKVLNQLVSEGQISSFKMIEGKGHLYPTDKLEIVFPNGSMLIVTPSGSDMGADYDLTYRAKNVESDEDYRARLLQCPGADKLQSMINEFDHAGLDMLGERHLRCPRKKE